MTNILAIDQGTSGTKAIVAVDTRNGSLVAVCRYVLDRQRPRAAEFAIAVVDEWQGIGIGTTLGQQIVIDGVFFINGNFFLKNSLADVVSLRGNEDDRAWINLVGEIDGVGFRIVLLLGDGDLGQSMVALLKTLS